MIMYCRACSQSVVIYLFQSCQVSYVFYFYRNLYLPSKVVCQCFVTLQMYYVDIKIAKVVRGFSPNYIYGFSIDSIN